MYQVVLQDKANVGFQNREQYMCQSEHLALDIAIRLGKKNKMDLWTDEIERIRKGGEIYWQNWIAVSGSKAVWVEPVQITTEIPSHLFEDD